MGISGSKTTVQSIIMFARLMWMLGKESMSKSSGIKWKYSSALPFHLFHITPEKKNFFSLRHCLCHPQSVFMMAFIFERKWGNFIIIKCRTVLHFILFTDIFYSLFFDFPLHLGRWTTLWCVLWKSCKCYDECLTVNQSFSFRKKQPHWSALLYFFLAKKWFLLDYAVLLMPT